MLSLEKTKTAKIAPEIHNILKTEAARHNIALFDLVDLILTDWIRRQGLSLPPAQRARATTPDLFLVGPATRRDDDDQDA